MRIEEIVISELPSEPTEEQSNTVQELCVALKQNSRFRLCEYSFGLFNHHFLSIKVDEAFHYTREYQLHIGILDPEPIRSLRISWGFIVAFSVLSGTAVLAGFTNLLTNSSIFIPILLVCAGLILLVAVHRSYDRLLFYSQNGRIPLVTLFNRKPDQEAFSSFIAKLTDQIREASTNLNYIYGNEMLNIELREHRRLMETGVISKDEYNMSKSSILSAHR
jgi:cytochrome c oxidase subunit IV